MGSGITYIVGENNVGKTSLIETFVLHGGCTLSYWEKFERSGPVFELRDITDNIARKVYLRREDSYELKEEPVLNRADDFEIIAAIDIRQLD